MIQERTAFAETLANTRERLLGLRGAQGHWVGSLSSSALSTATALFALSLFTRQKRALTEQEQTTYRSLVEGGIRWLIGTQNPDGGWGDTTASLSNISTTALCWAALSVSDSVPPDVIAAAEAWLIRAAGSLEPARLANAIADRYGKDRTFSVPILTMCALAGRLGPGRSAWNSIPRLPFELAACPYQWFQWLRLPVVSYALPALIAMGQAGHHFNPTGNPLGRLVRGRARPRTLRVLEAIQPEGGGFLEAVPLTSFVTMSLIGSEQTDHPVVTAGVDFLARSVRANGSWPIDTNLATWLTTLSINALAADPDFAIWMPEPEREAVRRWLLGQQYRVEHPYTHATPGGWAWTDLPGGVPDADDTAGALLALRHLGPPDGPTLEAAQVGVAWLLGLQNRDGGIPTFCRGWGALPFDRSGADLTAHALLAWNAWRDLLPPPLSTRVRAAMRRSLDYLTRTQRRDGSWISLWFGNQSVTDDQNPTYGTARVLMALLALEKTEFSALEESTARGIAWLLNAQNAEGGWGGDRETPASLEETGLALQALARACKRGAASDTRLRAAVTRGLAWLSAQTDNGRDFPPSPIGFYFARLWYFEQLYPVIFTAGALAQAAELFEEK